MNELQLINKCGVFYADSRQVAEMISKDHAMLMRDIRKYVNVLTNANLQALDFFVKATYTDSKGESRPCYLLSRKGCDMVANKMTGDKGILFTAEYVTRFDEMERTLKNNVPVSAEELFLQSAKLFAEHGREIKALKNVAAAQNSRIGDMEKKVQLVYDCTTITHDNWRTHVRPLINQIAKYIPVLDNADRFSAEWQESYRRLEREFNCNLTLRVNNKRERLRLAGATKKVIDKVNNLDIIGEDKRLIECYISILKRMVLEYKRAA